MQAISFQRHALKCEMPGMLAKLEIGGVDEPCPLTFTGNKTVEGLCPAIPTGNEQQQFRLVYFALIDDPTRAQLDLAVSLKTLDLREQTNPQLVLAFETIGSYPDDDGTGGTNIEEWCNGSNPRG